MSNILQREMLDLTTEQYYIKHLQIIGAFLPVSLTPKEIEVLGLFMSFEENAIVKQFDAPFRKIVREKLKLTHSGLSGHIANLKEKGAITEELSGDLVIRKVLYPADGQQFYQFKIKIKDE